MRKNKKARIKEEKFWDAFFSINVPNGINQLPRHLNHVRFRLYNTDNEGLAMMVPGLDSIDILDLDETDITNEGIKYLQALHFIRELRLKGCNGIDDDCIPAINKIKGLQLLHLGSTPVTTDGVIKLFVPTLKQLFISAGHDADSKAKLRRFAGLSRIVKL